MVQLQAAMAAAAPGLRICWRGLASGKPVQRRRLAWVDKGGAGKPAGGECGPWMELATPLKSPAGGSSLEGSGGSWGHGHGGCGVRLADFVASGACLVWAQEGALHTSEMPKLAL